MGLPGSVNPDMSCKGKYVSVCAWGGEAEHVSFIKFYPVLRL